MQMQGLKHYNASTIGEASFLLRQYRGSSKVIAGGTNLVGALREAIYPTYPEVLVNIKTIPGLDYIEEEGASNSILKIGALAKISDIATNPTIVRKYSVLAEAASNVASPEIRNMATIGGNLCQDIRCWYYRARGNLFNCVRKGGAICNAETGQNQYSSIFGGPSGCYGVNNSDIGTALVALNATVVTNRREILVEDFFTDSLSGTVLKLGEIVTEVQVPAPMADSKQAYFKFRVRKAIDRAIVSVAAVITMDAGKVSEARIALGAVAPKILRATDAENYLIGKTISTAVADTAGGMAVMDAVPLSKNAHKIPITRAFVKRAILS